MARQYYVTLPLDTVDWIADGPSHRLSQLHCVLWGLGFDIHKGFTGSTDCVNWGSCTLGRGYLP